MRGKIGERKGGLGRKLIFFAVAVLAASIVIYGVNSIFEQTTTKQEDTVGSSFENMNIRLVKSKCKSRADNYCSGEVPPQCPDEIKDSQKWACRQKTGEGTKESPVYCYELWTRPGGGGVSGIPEKC
ncbi:MAG: hypothetical protein SVV03_02125 [Candidatus Nanohaloarchaea archaeon]|nr:hypothetical protein [Candidatus Nanohaloarchaea archaeon]